MNRADMDHLVDQTARELMSTPLSPDFHAHVLARIDATPSRRPWWRPAAAAGAVAGVAVVAVALGLIARAPAPTPPARPPMAELASPPVTPGVPEAPRVEPLAVSNRTARRPRGDSATSLTEAERAWRRRALPALAEPDAIVLDGIQPSAVAIPLLDVTPLAAVPLAIAPIGRGGD